MLHEPGPLTSQLALFPTLHKKSARCLSSDDYCCGTDDREYAPIPILPLVLVLLCVTRAPHPTVLLHRNLPFPFSSFDRAHDKPRENRGDDDKPCSRKLDESDHRETSARTSHALTALSGEVGGLRRELRLDVEVISSRLLAKVGQDGSLQECRREQMRSCSFVS